MHSFKDETLKRILNSIGGLSRNSFVFLTNMSTGITWIPEDAADFFGIEEREQKDFYQNFVKRVHPRDQEEYLEGMAKKLSLEDVGIELCIRFLHEDRYCLCNILADTVEQEGTLYLVVVLRNNNVGPELDYVTDLYGISRFLEDVAYNIEKKQPMALLMVGLKHMDEFNMLYGQKNVDFVYHMLALRFIYLMSGDTAVYRVNDSGFVFVLKNYTREQTEQFAQQIREILQTELIFQERKLVIMCNMSGLMVDGSMDLDANAIQGKLEYMLNLSQEKYRGQLVFFNDIVQFNQTSNLEIIRMIHRAVRRDCDGFYVEYQPIVDAQKGNIVGAEALVRWKKEPYGVVPPGLFIGWMENNPTMYLLGNFVLETAVRDSLDFVARNPKFFVNVNVSCKQLERREFKDDVVHILEKYRFDSRNLCLELTERCKDIPMDLLLEDIEFFRERGIRVALDDYGTGSASAARVLSLPIDEIKLDMSFVLGIMDNPKQQALVKNILAFATEAGIYSCIEGVEDEPLQDFLRQYSATWFQGYYYSKPISAEKLLELMGE